MIIVQISDSHIVEKGELTLGCAPTADNLAACVAHINAMQPPPDLVLHSGDVTDAGSLLANEHAAEILDELHCPYTVVPGNHDRMDTLQQVFGGDRCPAPDYVIENPRVRIIALDSTRKGESGGELTAAQLAWLDAQLGEQSDQPTIIFMHHPPIKIGVLETDEDGFIGADALGEIVARHRHIEAILCGHIHLLTHTMWNGTIVSTAPSMAMRLSLDLTMTQESAFYLDDPAYLLHNFGAQGQLTTHAIRVDRQDGPHLF